MKVKCDKCEGHGFIEVEEPKLSLASMIEPFITKDSFGFKVKTGATIERLKPLNWPEVEKNSEAFGDVVKRIDNVE